MRFSVDRRTQVSACAIVLVASSLAFAEQGGSVPGDARITLERTLCPSFCPVYSVSVDARGNITYVGKDYVRVVGQASARIAASRVSELLDRAQQIRFFDLRDEYKAIDNPDGTQTIVTELQTTIVTIVADGRSKRVEDYLGAPHALREFERAIDQVTRSQRWVRIDTQTLQELLASGWSPSEAERAELLRKALQGDDVDVVRMLLDIGADPNGEYSGEYYGLKTTPLMLVRSAAAARMLLDAGSNPLAVNDDGQTPLRSAAFAPPEVTAVLLTAGSPVSVVTDALWHAACGGNSGAVALLIQARADVNATWNGVTPAACALGRKAALAAHRSVPLPDDERPFIPDFDAVLALLEKARLR
ncbi:MAG TPA: DUF6438 domain-containing protein [Vicinamibacterales bacterium]|jgi:hypothetical protein